MATQEDIERIAESLRNPAVPLNKRFRALFTLKNIGGPLAVQALASALNDDSALLKHELAYCLGQLRDPSALPYLKKILSDSNENPMVRHEAAEAMGAIGDQSSVQILEKYLNDPQAEVSETCMIALDRLKWLESKKKEPSSSGTHYTSVDPAPPLSKTLSVSDLQRRLNDQTLPLFKRYRAMFSLRNIGGEAAVEALCTGLNDPSALFRHEIAFVLGQMQDPSSVQALSKVLEKKEENEMVRHEAAEALGAIDSEEIVPMLKRFVADDHRVVRESCAVALDIYDYFTSDQFQYADALQQ